MIKQGLVSAGIVVLGAVSDANAGAPVNDLLGGGGVYPRYLGTTLDFGGSLEPGFGIDENDQIPDW